VSKAPKRKAPNMSEKLAAALRKIKLGVEGGHWLIPEPLRSEGTAKQICSSVDFDHIRRWAEGGTNAPQNLDPMIRAEHREKSRKDTTEVAKGKRMAKKEEAHRELIERRRSSQAVYDAVYENVMNRQAKPKRKINSRPFPTKKERRAFIEKVKLR
jgi:hypothetical protein